MVAYKHLVPDPVFECDGLHYVRLGERRAVVLKHVDGAPVTGFHGEWRPVFLHDGLACMSFLTLEQHGAKASWMVSPDGRRLGDKLGDLAPAQLLALGREAAARGLDRLDGLIGDAIQFIEPMLLSGIIALAAGTRNLSQNASSGTIASASRRALAMLGAPARLQPHLLFRPGEHNPGEHNPGEHSPGEHSPGEQTPDQQTLRLGTGWSDQHAGRAVGTESTAHGERVPSASRFLLTLALVPAGTNDGDPPANIEIIANRASVGRVRLDPRWQSEGADFAFWLAPEHIAGQALEIVFRHDQDFTLSTLRLEHAGRVSVAALAPRDVMMRFENVGDNCEFGLVQRHYGAEPVGLLRFAGLRNPRRLVRFLEDEFGRFGEPGSLGTSIIGGEYWIVDHTYGIAYHTFRYRDEVDEAEVIRENEIKAMYLKRKFREDLEDGEKILVYKRVVTQDPHEMLALHAALNRFGTINPMLWVTQADTEHAPGSVQWIGDRLLQGFVGRISLENANDFDPETWLLLCRNALLAFEATDPAC